MLPNEDALDTNSETSSVSSDNISKMAPVSSFPSKTSSKAGSSTGGRSSAQATINKLTHEVAVLRESFEQLNGSDVVTLSSKLRGAKDDISNLRQRNFELKSRVQILEGKLFHALNSNSNGKNSSFNNSHSHNSTDNESVQSSSSSSKMTSRVSVIKRLHGNRLDDSESSSIAEIADSNNVILKNEYLEKTNASLLEKVRELQGLLEQQSSSSNTTNTTATAAATAAAAATTAKPVSKQRRKEVPARGAGVHESIKQLLLSSSLCLDRSPNDEEVERLSLDTEALVASLREGDGKTIRELAVEVKTLSRWAPKDEDNDDDDCNNDNNIITDGTQNNSINKKRVAGSSSETVIVDVLQQAPHQTRHMRRTADRSYGTSHMYCSFALGVLFMLLSFAVRQVLDGGGATLIAQASHNMTLDGQ